MFRTKRYVETLVINMSQYFLGCIRMIARFLRFNGRYLRPFVTTRIIWINVVRRIIMVLGSVIMNRFWVFSNFAFFLWRKLRTNWVMMVKLCRPTMLFLDILILFFRRDCRDLAILFNFFVIFLVSNLLRLLCSNFFFLIRIFNITKLYPTGASTT